MSQKGPFTEGENKQTNKHTKKLSRIEKMNSRFPSTSYLQFLYQSLKDLGFLVPLFPNSKLQPLT